MFVSSPAISKRQPSIQIMVFELLVMFFDMSNSFTIFQTMINNIFQDLIAEDILIMYFNNILIFTWTLEKHHKIAYRVLKVLVQYKLFLYLEKYKVNRFYIKYLSLVIFKDQVEINLVKVTEACNQSISANCIDLQIFLKFTKFYQRSIYGFLDITQSLFDLTRGTSIWT